MILNKHLHQVMGAKKKMDWSGLKREGKEKKWKPLSQTTLEEFDRKERERSVPGCRSKDNRSFNGASLVAQWLRICLPMQGTRVRALVWEDPTCCGATGPVSHNY